MMVDQLSASLRAHRSNIERYRSLLKTSLTEFERQFVEKQLTEEQIHLDSLTLPPLK
jgi:hypothetical protein